MTLQALLNDVKTGVELVVANRPFLLSGKATIELAGGDLLHWLFDRDGAMIAISPNDEEIFLFSPISDELEPDEEGVTYHGVDYEFSYEDEGTVNEVEGSAELDADDRYRLADYENEDGERVRIITNEDTEDTLAYAGTLIVEDDIALVE